MFFSVELESFLIEITATILRKKDDQSPLKEQNKEKSNSANDDDDAEDEIRYIKQLFLLFSMIFRVLIITEGYRA